MVRWLRPDNTSGRKGSGRYNRVSPGHMSGLVHLLSVGAFALTEKSDTSKQKRRGEQSGIRTRPGRLKPLHSQVPAATLPTELECPLAAQGETRPGHPTPRSLSLLHLIVIWDHLAGHPGADVRRLDLDHGSMPQSTLRWLDPR